MTAAEKLRALDAQLLHVRPWGSDVWVLRNALPQIMAVVEAAEQIGLSVKVRSKILPSALRAESDAVLAALAALDEVLG